MKQKGLLLAYIVVTVLLVHVILVVGCGKNPLLGSFGSSLNVGVGSLNFLTSMKGSTSWLAHNSSNPENFIVTVTEITLQKEDGSYVNVWKGSEEVDLAKMTSLADVKTFTGDIAPGKYKTIDLYSGKSEVKVKGSVTLGTTTYYTKTNHTNYTTGPAELEIIDLTDPISGEKSGMTNTQQKFSPAIQIGGPTSVSDIYVLYDLSNILVYYDGNESTSGGKLYIGETGAKMYVQRWTYAVTIGAPGKKEVYNIDSSGTGRLTLLFDNSDNILGGCVRQLLINNTLGNNIFPTWAPTISSFTKNTDGTYTLLQYGYNPSGVDTSNWFKFANFQRSSHIGNFSKVFQGSTTTGTYTATRIN